MIKKLLTGVLAAGSLGFAAMAMPASAEEVSTKPEDRTGVYIPLQVGTGFGTEVDGSIYGVPFEAEGRTTFNGSAGIGYDFGHVRAEVRGGYRGSNISEISALGYQFETDVDDSGFELAVGAAVDFPTNSRLVPYVGAEFISVFADESNTQGAVGKLGVSYLAAKNLDVFAEVTYTHSFGEERNYGEVDPYGEFGIGAGVRIRL